MRTSGSKTGGFDSICGIQAGSPFYVIMCKLKDIPKLLPDIDYDMPPELRAQRMLQESRIPVLKDYILSNQDSYVFSSLTASVDGDIKFIPSAHLGPDGKVGRLYPGKNAKFLINDGQHRRHAIEEALKVNPKLGHESITIVLFEDKGLEKSQQIFADLNKYARKPSTSLNILYDKRDTFGQFIVKMIKEIDIFKNRVDLENNSISERSAKVFSLSRITTATMKLFSHKKIKKITNDKKTQAIDYWGAVSRTIPEWKMLMKEKVTPREVRENYIHTNSSMLNSLGVLGRVLFKECSDEWKQKISLLREVNWHRNNPEWEGNLLQGGRIVNTTIGIELGANILIQKCGLQLPDYRKVFEVKK